MKIKIENYKSILEGELEIKKGEITYFLGANESGKTSILKSFQSMDFNSGVPTIRDHTKFGFGTRETKFHVYDGEKENIINENSWMWFVSSGMLSKYRSSLREHEINEYENLLNKKAADGEEIDIDVSRKIISKFLSGDFMKEQEIEQVKLLFPNTFDESFELYEDLKISFPLVVYNQPLLLANINEIDRYKYKSLWDDKSMIRNIFDSFLSNEYKDKISELYDMEGNADKTDVVLLRDKIIDMVNEKIKDYFKKIEAIDAWPKFKFEGDEIILIIEDKNKYEIDSKREDDRSTGFKSFLRMMIEIKSIISKDVETIYLIDEPEQSLHPVLQREFIKVIGDEIKDKNIYVLVSTHSPYLINENVELKNINFVSRNKGEIGELPTGATYWKNLKDDDLFYKLLKDLAESKIGKDDEKSLKLIIHSKMEVGNIDRVLKEISDNEMSIEQMKTQWWAFKED